MIDITNVVNISVSAPSAGIAPYSVNNLLCLTKDTPVVSLGTDKYRVYTNPTDVGTDWGTTSNVYDAAVAVFSQSPNILTGGGKFLVAPLVTDETLDDAVARIGALCYFGGVGYTYAATDGEITDAAEVCQTGRKLLFVATDTVADLETAGLLYDLQDASLTYARGLYHGDADMLDAFKWAYAGRAMSTNFDGSNTTQTMHLKQLVGVTADATMTSTILAKCAAVGADTYVDIAGRSSLMTYGANGFFDDMYNLAWFVGALEVAGFNALATTSTKLPQTEQGMDFLKNEYAKVCRQAATNRFIGAGAWTSPDTFGDQSLFMSNIASTGFYIYSQPVAAQSSANRAQRQAPVVQIAVKYQGAIHSTSVIINVNA